MKNFWDKLIGFPNWCRSINTTEILKENILSWFEAGELQFFDCHNKWHVEGFTIGFLLIVEFKTVWFYQMSADSS